MEQLVIRIDRRRSRRIVKGLILISVVLALVSLVANLSFIHGLPGSGSAVAVFGVDEEASIPTWWSTMLLASLSLLTAAAGAKLTTHRSDRLAWFALSALFMFLSIDEGAMLHERVGYLLDVQGRLHHSRWIIVWVPLAALVGGLIGYRLWRFHRKFALGLILGALIFLTGAVGVETLNNVTRYEQHTQADVVDTPDTDAVGEAATSRRAENGGRTYPYCIGTTVEELLEMLGTVFWIGVVFRAGNSEFAETSNSKASS